LPPLIRRPGIDLSVTDPVNDKGGIDAQVETADPGTQNSMLAILIAIVITDAHSLLFALNSR